MPKQIAPDVLRRIRQLAKSGYTNSQIAREVGCDRHTVARHLDPGPATLAAKAAPGTLTADDLARLQVLARSLRGWPCEQCGRQILVLNSMAAGICAHCGAAWEVRVTRGTSAARG